MWKTPSWFQKIKAQNFQRIFAIGIFLFRGELLFHHYIECYIVSGSFWYNQVSYMVTNRDKKSVRSPRKNSKYCSGDWPRWRSWPAFRHLVNHFAESFRMPKSSKISSTIWSIITEVVTVSGRPGRGAKQMEKSQRLNWVTQISTVAYDGACSPHVSIRMTWISFRFWSCRKKILHARWWINVFEIARVSWNFPSATVTRRDLQFGTWTDQSFQRNYQFRPMTVGSRPG